MIENIVLGSLQGIFEWLPISSEAVLVLAQTHLFSGGTATEMIGKALFFHFGTFLAAIIYFWSDVSRLFSSLFKFKKTSNENKSVLKFLIITTTISGGLGILLLSLIDNLSETISLTGQVVTAFIGLLLLGTGFLQLKSKKLGKRLSSEANNTDSVLLGFLQGLAALPGFSRSGLTVSGLLLRDFKEDDALKLSFLMSLPIVLAGNIILNASYFVFTLPAFIGLLSSFIFGLATIHGLLELAKRFNFGYFVIGFGLITILFAFV